MKDLLRVEFAPSWYFAAAVAFALGVVLPLEQRVGAGILVFLFLLSCWEYVWIVGKRIYRRRRGLG